MRLRPAGSLAALALLLLAAAVTPWLPAADEPTPGVVTTLRGHRENVFGIAFAPDGKLIVTASGDPSIKVWEAASGKLMKTFGEGTDGHKQIVLSVAVSPDGSQFATTSADNSLKVWDMPTSRFLKELVQASAPRSVAVTADGARVAAGSTDGKVRLYTTADGKMTSELAAGTAAVNALAFTANGQTLAALSADGALRYWNVAAGNLLAAYAAHPGEGTAVAFSPSNVAFTTGADGALKYWAFPAVASKDLLKNEAVRELSMASDGTAYVMTTGKTVRLGSLTDGSLKSTFAADVDLTASASGGGHVAAGTGKGEVILWKAKENKIVARLPAHAGAVTGVGMNAGGTQLATAGKDGVVRLWALPVNPTRKADTAGPIAAYLALADGKRFVVGGADKAVRLYKLDGGLERQLTGHTGAVRAVAIAADGKTIASAGEAGNVRVWGSKAETANLLGAHTAPVVSLFYTGNRVLSASADGSVKLWEVAAPTTKGLMAHAGAVSVVAVSPDGQRIATGSDDKQVRVWSLASDKVERTLTGPTLGILSVAYSRAGDRVAAGSADKSLFVWDAAGKEVRKLVGLPAAVKAVGLPADGKTVLAGLADGTVKHYEIATGKEGKALTGHKAAVSALVLPSKGDQVVTGGEDGTVIVQPLAGGAATTIKAAGPVQAVAVRPDAAVVAVAAGKQVQLFTPAGKLESTIDVPANVRGLGYSFDGKRLAVAADDGKARVYDAAGRLEEHLAHEGAVTGVAFTTDGKRLISASADKSARNRPLSLVWQARPGAAVTQAILSPRGDRVIAACADGMVHQINLADGKVALSVRAHKGAAAGVSVSNDVSRMATVGDGVVRVFELAKLPAGKTGGKDLDPPAKETKLPAAPLSVALSPNGLRLAVGTRGEKGADRIHIYDPLTAQALVTLGETEPLSANVLTWQADNRTLTAAGEDRSVRLIDVSITAAFEAHAGGVTGLSVSPAGNLIATGGADKTVRTWSPTTGKQEKLSATLPEAPAAVAFSFDGAQVAAVAGKRATVWTVADGKAVAEIDAPTPLTGVSVSSDKARIATAGDDGRARVWDVATKKEAQAFLHDGAVTALAWSRSQPAQLFTAGADKLTQLHTVGLVRQVTHDRPLRALAVSGNSAFVVVGGDDGKARRYNASSGAAEKTYEASDKALSAVAITKGEATIAAAGADGKLRLFASGDGKLVSTITLAAPARTIAFTPDNKGIVCGLSDGTIEGRDVQYTAGAALPADFGRVLQSYTHDKGVSAVAFPGTGTQFWSVGSDRSLKAWKLASESPTRTFAHPSAVNAVLYNKDGTRAVSACSDGKVRVFDLTKGTQLKQIDAHLTKDATSVYGIALSPDGKQVATAGMDGAAKVFEADSGKLVREFKAYSEKDAPAGHRDSVLCVAFSPDGKQVASAGMDQTIKVWNVADGKLVREMVNPAMKGVAHPGWVYSMRWTTDGKTLVSAGAAPRLKGYVAVWEAGTGKQVYGKELAVGTIFCVALSPDEKLMALGTGGSLKGGADIHQGLILKMPGREKD